MNRQELIDHYLRRLSDKNFMIYDVRRELEQQKVDEEEIKQIMRAVDTELQDRLLKSANKDDTAVIIRIGVILMSIGVALGLGIAVGMINGADFFIFVYGAFFGGLAVVLVGLFKRKKIPSRGGEQNDDGGERKRVSFRKNLRDK